MQVDNPGTGEALAEIALADAADIDAGVKAAIACHASGVLTAMRPVERGRMVNRVSGDPASQLHERHDASDFETKTQDKVAPAT